ncbi:MAG: hypothetical protein AB2L20_21180 [Mangrovibacterium sp.]
MKKIAFYSILILITVNCNKNEYADSFSGNWYTVNKDSAFYEEVYIADSMLVHYDNVIHGLIAFNYEIKNDTIFIFHNRDKIINKYKISFKKGSTEKMIFEYERKTYEFNRLDLAIDDLEGLFRNEAKMDTFLFEVYKRSQKKLME